MKRLLAFLIFLPLLATASVDITNIPLGGFAMTDTLLGVTNANWAARGTVQDIAGTATNGWTWTNLTVAHAGAVTNGYPWTNVPVSAASTVPISGVTTPGAILTNGNSFGVLWSNATANIHYGTNLFQNLVVMSNNLVIAQTNNNMGLYVTNGNNYVVITNGAIITSGTVRPGGTVTISGSLFAGANQVIGWSSGPEFKMKDTSTTKLVICDTATGSKFPNGRITWGEEWPTNPCLQSVNGTIPSFLVIDGTATNTANLIVSGAVTATNGVVIQTLYTNGYTLCTTNKQFYFVNSSTNPLFVLPNAANVPGVIYRFSTTNYGANFIITNATGTQTIANGSYLSYTNTDNGIKVTSFISDGAHWWLASKGKTTLPNASWSCSTNTTFVNVTNTVTLDTTENNNGQGIYLDNSAWFTPGVGSRIWVTNAGQYMITFSAVWSKVGGGAANGDIWLRQNSVDVPRTMTLMTIQNATSTNVMTVNFIMPVTGVTYFDLQGASPDGTAQLQAMPAITSPFNRPACPSIIVTVNKVSD